MERERTGELRTGLATTSPEGVATVGLVSVHRRHDEEVEARRPARPPLIPGLARAVVACIAGGSRGSRNWARHSHIGCQEERAWSDLLEMDSSGGAANSAFNLGSNIGYHDIIDAEFMRTLFDERLLTVRGHGWITRAGIDQAPGEVIARASYFHSAREECLVRVEQALAHIILSDRALTVRVAAGDRPAAEAALDEIRAALPDVEGADQCRSASGGGSPTSRRRWPESCLRRPGPRSSRTTQATPLRGWSR